MNLIVSEYKPPGALQNYVESYWHGRFNLDQSSDFSQYIVPNGCIELIIHLGEDHCSLKKEGEDFHKSPPYTLLGVHTKSYIVKFSEIVNCFGIRFYPDGFHKIFGVPPGLFLSTYEDGVDVIGKRLVDFSNTIIAACPEEMRTLSNRFFELQLSHTSSGRDYAHIAMKFIRQTNGLIGFEEIRDKIPISFRQLQREFKYNYGLKINDYLRLTRLNAINKYMLSRPSNLTEIAHELNFTDQSHFIREFKHFTGIAPGKFFKKMEDFILIPV